jgi:hypothetical protein
VTEPNTAPLTIPPDIAARCTGPDQFGNFDRIVRNVLAIPKSLAEKAHHKGNRPKKAR